MLTESQTYARGHVGNGLNCSSCHLDAGREAYASPWVGLWGVFPEYRSRNGQVDALQDRLNDCFERSMNGKPLPYNSDEMRGMLAYIWRLSTGVPTGVAVRGRGFATVRVSRPADQKRGKGSTRRSARCVTAPMASAQRAERRVSLPGALGPPVVQHRGRYGRLNNAAGFVKTSMPSGQGNMLSDADALDVAAYFTRQSRPDFAAKSKDCRRGQAERRSLLTSPMKCSRCRGRRRRNLAGPGNQL